MEAEPLTACESGIKKAQWLETIKERGVQLLTFMEVCWNRACESEEKKLEILLLNEKESN